MNLSETAQALGLAQAYDRRTVGEMDVRAWHAILGDLATDDVLAAIRLHYTEQTEWIMPAHIRQRVGAWKADQRRAERHTGWAAGQAGVPKDQIMPEITGPIAEGELTAPVRALLDSVRAMLPEGSREALMPRQVAWEKEYDAYRRQQDAQPNPHYRPRTLAEVQSEPVRVGCGWHEAGGYGFVWNCRWCKETDQAPPA